MADGLRYAAQDAASPEHNPPPYTLALPRGPGRARWWLCRVSRCRLYIYHLSVCLPTCLPAVLLLGLNAEGTLGRRWNCNLSWHFNLIPLLFVLFSLLFFPCVIMCVVFHGCIFFFSKLLCSVSPFIRCVFVYVVSLHCCANPNLFSLFLLSPTTDHVAVCLLCVLIFTFNSGHSHLPLFSFPTLGMSFCFTASSRHLYYFH